MNCIGSKVNWLRSCVKCSVRIFNNKRQSELPFSVRKVLSRNPGMWVSVKVNGKSAQITPTPTKKTVSLKEIQSRLKHDGPAVAVGDMRVTDYKE